MGDLWSRVLGGYHLALLGQLDAALDGPWWLGQDRHIRGPAAAAEGAAAAVKEGEAHTVGTQELGERRLRAVNGPRRGQVADVLVGVRVPNHYLLPVPPGAKYCA